MMPLERLFPTPPGWCAKPVNANCATSATSFGESTATAYRQHGGNALQKRVALLDRQQAGRVHDDLKLGIGEANHVTHRQP